MTNTPQKPQEKALSEGQDISVPFNEFVKIASRIKKIHGFYEHKMSFAWNVLNFINCSHWNDRWGRRYAKEPYWAEYLKALESKLSQAWGRSKNLLHYSMKMKQQLSDLRKEYNHAKQIHSNQLTTLRTKLEAMEVENAELKEKIESGELAFSQVFGAYSKQSEQIDALKENADKWDELQTVKPINEYHAMEQKCDVCGRHPNVIIQTRYGTYCEQHVQY